MVVTVVPQAAEDALRLELKRFNRRVDAKDRRLTRTRYTQVDAARRRSVCRRESERKDLNAAHKNKM